MKVTVCVTIYNEKRKVFVELLDSLKRQSLKPNEIIVVDASKTPVLLPNKKYKFKLIHRPNISRSKARNIAISKSNNEIVALTDCGCVADFNWLKNITKPIFLGKSEVVAGFYRMKYSNGLQKAMRIFLGVLPNRFDKNFLPSTRSFALTKNIWRRLGGFDENINDTAEDTQFNYKLIKNGIHISRVKSALVEWGMPEGILDFFKKIYKYAKGDVRSKIIIFPGKHLTSHNIKVIFVYIRYLLGVSYLVMAYMFDLPLLYLYLGILLYLFYAYKKAGLWGILLQLTADIAVMLGFASGIIGL